MSCCDAFSSSVVRFLRGAANLDTVPVVRCRSKYYHDLNFCCMFSGFPCPRFFKTHGSILVVCLAICWCRMGNRCRRLQREAFKDPDSRGEDGSIVRATFCGTLASVVCVSDYNTSAGMEVSIWSSSLRFACHFPCFEVTDDLFVGSASE